MNKEAEDFFYELMGSFTGAYPDPIKIKALIGRCYSAGQALGRLDTGNRAADLWNELERNIGEMHGKVTGYESIYDDDEAARIFPDPMKATVTIKRVAQRELVIRWVDRSGKQATLPDVLTESIEKRKASLSSNEDR